MCWRFSVLWGLVLVVCALSGAGCSDTPKTTPPACPQPGAVRQVPINVIRVLHSKHHDIDVPGSPTNKGCRLTDDQINDYINQADAFLKDTCKVGLNWNGMIDDLYVDLEDMPNCSARERRIEWFWKTELQFLPPRSLSHLNIYFHGNMRPSNGPECGNITLVANTVDPSDEGEWAGITIWRHIMINDRAGVQPELAGRFVSADRILEHELAHWLLRQRATQGGRYDGAEHCSSCGLIMKDPAPHPGEFWETPPSVCERHEIWTQAADWNEP